jgi:hypothetical protein
MLKLQEMLTLIGKPSASKIFDEARCVIIGNPPHVRMNL